MHLDALVLVKNDTITKFLAEKHDDISSTPTSQLQTERTEHEKQDSWLLVNLLISVAHLLTATKVELTADQFGGRTRAIHEVEDDAEEVGTTQKAFCDTSKAEIEEAMATISKLTADGKKPSSVGRAHAHG